MGHRRSRVAGGGTTRLTNLAVSTRSTRLAATALSLTPMQPSCGDTLHAPGKPHRQTFILLLVDDWSWPAAQKFLILCEEHLIGTRADLFQLLIEPI
jgi:hypothetical protein